MLANWHCALTLNTASVQSTGHVVAAWWLQPQDLRSPVGCWILCFCGRFSQGHRRYLFEKCNKKVHFSWTVTRLEFLVQKLCSQRLCIDIYNKLLKSAPSRLDHNTRELLSFTQSNRVVVAERVFVEVFLVIITSTVVLSYINVARHSSCFCKFDRIVPVYQQRIEGVVSAARSEIEPLKLLCQRQACRVCNASPPVSNTIAFVLRRLGNIMSAFGVS